MGDEKRTRVALYARCSTIGDRQDPESQLMHLRQYAAARGWDVAGEYVDRASAVNIRARAAWREVLDLAAKRRIDVIAVARLDRAFRSMMHLTTTIEQLRASGAALVSLSEPWVNTAEASPMADLIRNILGSVAEFERGLIAERVRAGMDRAKRQGRRLGRPKKVNSEWEAIRRRLAHGDLTKREAAEALGVSRATLYRLWSQKGDATHGPLSSAGSL